RREPDPIAMGHRICQGQRSCELLVNDSARASVADVILTEGQLSEYNIWRFHPSPDGVGIVAYQYARRARGPGGRAILNATRERSQVNEFIRALLPPPSAPPNGERAHYYTTTGRADG